MAPFDPEQFLYDLSPVLARPHDEVDQLLLHPDPTERDLALKHPGVTEDHLIRRLDSIFKQMEPDRGWTNDIESAIEHPAAGDRLHAFAAFAPKADPRFHFSSYGALAKIKDPALADAVAKQFDAIPLVHRNNRAWYAKLLTNPHLPVEQKLGYLLNARDGANLLGEVNDPAIVNAYAQHHLNRLASGEKANPTEIGKIFSHSQLDPSFLEKFANTNEAFYKSHSWLNAVADRHPEAKRLFANAFYRHTPGNQDNFWEAIANSNLSQDHGFVDRIIKHKNANVWTALDRHLGSAQLLDHLARTSKDESVLDLLASQYHPQSHIRHFDMMLNRDDLSQRFKSELAPKLLDRVTRGDQFPEESILNAMRFAQPADVYHQDLLAEKLSREGVNSIASDQSMRDWHPTIMAHPRLSKEAQLAFAKNKDNAPRLLENDNLHPDVLSEIIKPSQAPHQGFEDPIRVVEMAMVHRNFGERHHDELKSYFPNHPTLYRQHLEKTKTPRHLQEAFEQIKNSHNPNGERELDILHSILTNRHVSLPEDIIEYGLNSPDEEVSKAAANRIAPHRFDSIIDRHPKVVAKKTTEVRHLEQLANHPESAIRQAVYSNPAVPVEVLRAGLARLRSTPPNESQYSLSHTQEMELLKKLLLKHDPDWALGERVGVRFKTGKLRKVRDYIESVAGPGGELRLKDLPPKLADAVRSIKTGINPKNGNVNAKLLQQHIDSSPATHYNVSRSTWSGIQRHNDAPSNVFQLNITTDHVKQMKDAGVYDTFRKLQDMFRAHPISDTAFGWVRWTGKPGTNPGDGVFVDEVQSDHFVPLAEKARAQAMRTYSDPAKAQEAGQRAFEKANSATPVEHQKKINQILFGGKHASEVLLEAFHQHLRDQGHAGTKIAIHSIHTKAPISLGDMKRNPDGTVDKKTLPGHFVEGYENVPKSMGMDPAQYHQDNMATQDSPALQDKPTFQDDLRKRMK